MCIKLVTLKSQCHYVKMSPVRIHSYEDRTKQKTGLTQDCEYAVETRGVLIKRMAEVFAVLILGLGRCVNRSLSTTAREIAEGIYAHTGNVRAWVEMDGFHFCRRGSSLRQLLC